MHSLHNFATDPPLFVRRRLSFPGGVLSSFQRQVIRRVKPVSGWSSGCTSTKRSDACRTGEATTRGVGIGQPDSQGVRTGRQLVQAFRAAVRADHGLLSEVSVCPLHVDIGRLVCAKSGRSRGRGGRRGGSLQSRASASFGSGVEADFGEAFRSYPAAQTALWRLGLQARARAALPYLEIPPPLRARRPLSSDAAGRS